MSVRRNPASFRDPSGFVFERDGVLLRQINQSYAPHYDALMRSGLYEDLTREGLLVDHAEVNAASGLPGAYKVLRPDPLPFVSYPFEWCFSQLRDAALVTLDIQRRALERGLTLKDANAFNVQFHGGAPLLLDTLSFEIRQPGAPWIAYRQFCQHFLAPLLLMQGVDVRLVDLLRSHLDGIPLDLTSTLLPRASWFRFSRLLHVHLHARTIARYSDTRPQEHRLHRPMSDKALLGLVDSLRGTVAGLSLPGGETEWSEYEQQDSYGPEAAEEKVRIVEAYLERIGPDSVWDLGANQGTYTRLAASLGAFVVSIDGDHGAIEKNYAHMREHGPENVLPLRIDLTNPSPALGWANRERMPLTARGRPDAVLALALIHHLALGHNLPLGHIAEWLHDLADHVVIEFVPKTDPQAQRLLLSRADVFADYTADSFEAAFGEWFRIGEKTTIPGTERTLYAMERRDRSSRSTLRALSAEA